MNQIGYKKAFPKDFSAGVVVFLVALPLCLGIALASGAPLISGITAGLVGGLFVAWISGSHTSVSGPAAGLTAIVLVQIDKLGSFEAFLCAVILAGVFQLLMGLSKAGSLAAFFPSSVIKGLLAAIGIILILKQIPHLFGHDPDWFGDMTFQQQDGKNTFTEIIATTFHIHPGAAAVGLISLALLIMWDRTALKKIPLPAPLVVVVLGTILTFVLRPMGQYMEIGVSHLVQVPGTGSAKDFLGTLPKPDFSVMFSSGVFIAAITVAIVATLETLLNLEAVDKLDPQKRVSPPNRELLAQGSGNIISGLLGGLPITSVIVRSSVNIATGGQTRMACFIHGIFLLTAVMFFPSLLNTIPLATLAAILIVTGFKLAGIPLFKQMWKSGRNQFVPFVITIIAIVLTDLLIGLMIGMGVAIFFVIPASLKLPARRVVEKRSDGDILKIELRNRVSFLNRASLMKTLHEVPNGTQLVIDASSTIYIDLDILNSITDFEKQTAPARDVKLSLVGFKGKQ